MEQIIKFLKNSPDCEDLVLILSLENLDYLIEFFNKHELYNDLARRFFELCDYEVFKVEEAVEYCKLMKIPTDLLQQNIMLDEPVQMKFKYKHLAPYTAMIYELAYNDFYKQFEEKINNHHLDR